MPSLFLKHKQGLSEFFSSVSVWTNHFLLYFPRCSEDISDEVCCRYIALFIDLPVCLFIPMDVNITRDPGDECVWVSPSLRLLSKSQISLILGLWFCLGAALIAISAACAFEKM